jgi:hypothetical protein
MSTTEDSGQTRRDGVLAGAVAWSPDEVGERALLVLQQQLTAAAQIVDSITRSQRQREVAARMSHDVEPPVPSTIDETF